MNLWSYIKERMISNPEQKICEGASEVTYESAAKFAEQFAYRIKNFKCCAILCHSEMNAAIAVLSCFAANVTALPLSYRYGEILCNKILDFVSPDAIITDSDGCMNINVTSSGKEHYLSGVHPALIMCTSGTSGIPKGVMLTEKNIITNVNDICDYFNIDDSDRILISRPVYHCAVLSGEFLTSLVKGAKIFFCSESFNPAVILKLIREKEITAFCTTPTLIKLIVRFKRNNTGYFLKHICVSGECMDRETGKSIECSFPNANIYHLYGLSEAGPRVSYLPPELFSKYPEFSGVPLKSVSLKIVRNDGGEAERNEIGVLWIKGENIMTGYYNDPVSTGKVFDNGWLCTNDMALINDEGLLKIMGRCDDLIIKGGMNIYPGEIESAVRQDARVREVYVYGFSDSQTGTQIAMDISGDFKNVRDVKALCVKILPDYQIPIKINLMPELAKNGSGKIIRR